MGTPFMAEIRIMGFNFAPQGWAQCNGQLMPINQNQALFSLLGTMYGGNGQTNFALPDFRGRVPIHFDSKIIGQKGGEEAHTVTISEMPTHTHTMMASATTGDSVNPSFAGTGHVLAQEPGNAYSDNVAGLASLNPASVSNVGGSQPHSNMQPYTTLNFCIALQGIFPSQN